MEKNDVKSNVDLYENIGRNVACGLLKDNAQENIDLAISPTMNKCSVDLICTARNVNTGDTTEFCVEVKTFDKTDEEAKKDPNYMLRTRKWRLMKDAAGDKPIIYMLINKSQKKALIFDVGDKERMKEQYEIGWKRMKDTQVDPDSETSLQEFFILPPEKATMEFDIPDEYIIMLDKLQCRQ